MGSQIQAAQHQSHDWKWKYSRRKNALKSDKIGFSIYGTLSMLKSMNLSRRMAMITPQS